MPDPLPVPPDRSDVHRALVPKPGRAVFEVGSKVAIAATIVVALGLAVYFGDPRWLFAPTGSRVDALCIVLAGLFFGRLGLLAYHALRYRPVPTPAPADLPLLTVIIPAYNEGPMVRVALMSALRSRYPHDKLEVLAIDDGSTDDTWAHIQRVAAAYPERVRALRQARNGGKREALRTGFLEARGEIIVTVDSDSELGPDALANIVAPLLRDASVAAVAGRVRVLNRDANIVTRLLAARFVITFDCTRAAQSHFGAVFCCPGALSAYRRAAVLAVLERWSTQTFLGAECTIGEDRALTTWLLKAGYRAEYQSNADVKTLMPTTFRGMTKMLVRWERGNIREDLVLVPTLATRWRTRDRWFPTFEVLYALAQVPLGYVGLVLLGVGVAQHPVALVTALGSFCVVAVLDALYCLRSERASDLLYGVAYAALSLFALQWVFPYSALTVRDGRWMTR